MARFLAIDWDGEEVRFVLCTQNQKDVLRVSKIGSGKIAKPSLEADATTLTAANRSFYWTQIGDALEKTLKEYQVSSASKTFFAVSSCSSNTMYFSLPPVKAEEIPDMLKNQAVRDMPNFQEIHPIDFLTFNENTSGPLKLLAVSLSRIDLKAIQNVGKTIHNRPDRIEYRGAATAAFMLNSGQISPEALPTLVVNLLADELDLIVIADQKIAYLRSVKLLSESAQAADAATGSESAKSKGVQNAAIRSEFDEKLFQEIVRTCAVGLQDISEDGVIENVIFLGAENEQNELIERLRQHSLDVVVFNPLTLAQLQSEQMPKHPGRFTALLGMVQNEALGKKPAIDLLHPKSKPQPPNYAAFVLLLVLLFSLTLGGLYYWNTRALKKIELQRDQLKGEYDTLFIQHQQISRPFFVLSNARQFDQTDAIWLDVIRDIEPALPQQQDMVIQRMSFVSGPIRGNQYGGYFFGQIAVNALIRDQSVFTQLKATLEAKKMYNILNPQIRQNPAGGGFPWTCHFTIACRKISDPRLYLQHLPAPPPSETVAEAPAP